MKVKLNLEADCEKNGGGQEMTESVEGQIVAELCPDGVWQLSDRMKNLLKRQIARLPNKSVTEEEAMYPTTAAGMREFLEVFFSRHYFQVQNSLLDYIVSEDFTGILNDGEIRILDIGCGPGVGVLAVTDVINGLLDNLALARGGPKQRPVRFVYVLNDISEICLSAGRRMLDEYFDFCGTRRPNIGEHRILALTNDFPDNAKQLRRIGRSFGAYHLAMFSYVVRPLVEDNGISGMARDIVETEKLCDPRGRILILQDQYRESLMRALGREIDVPVDNKGLTQEVFPDRGTTDTFSYSYYQCLYKPRFDERNPQYRKGHVSPEAVAG